MRVLVSFAVAFVASKLVFSAFDFHYDLFGEPFNIKKFAIDTAVFGTFYFTTFFVYGKLKAQG